MKKHKCPLAIYPASKKFSEGIKYSLLLKMSTNTFMLLHQGIEVILYVKQNMYVDSQQQLLIIYSQSIKYFLCKYEKATKDTFPQSFALLFSVFMINFTKKYKTLVQIKLTEVNKYFKFTVAKVFKSFLWKQNLNFGFRLAFSLPLRMDNMLYFLLGLRFV